jgi:hypothetical protein
MKYSSFHFGAWLEQWLASERKSVKWLSRQSGYAERTIYKYLKEAIFPLPALRRFSTVTGVDLMVYLLSDESRVYYDLGRPVPPPEPTVEDLQAEVAKLRALLALAQEAA